MNKPTLLILAAGMGSRYGGLKQMDAFGPNGETILDYSIYDAIREGFGKIVFVIRESFRKEFVEFFSAKFDHLVEVHYINQEIAMVPEGSEYNPQRDRPWGTAHAVYVAKEVVHEPFAVINADDFYGREAYKVLFDFFNSDSPDKNYSLVGYDLINTMSDHGTVNRGVCAVSDENLLEGIEETLKIGYDDERRIFYKDSKSLTHYLDPRTPVSMNMWAFYPDYFEYCESLFSVFLEKKGHELTSEFFIPLLIDVLIKENIKCVEVLRCRSEWFGVTYKEDKPIVIDRLTKLINEGIYPKNLWGVRK